jgi:hypothetical protein
VEGRRNFRSGREQPEITMPDIDDIMPFIMPFITPQTAMLVIIVLVLLVVALAILGFVVVVLMLVILAVHRARKDPSQVYLNEQISRCFFVSRLSRPNPEGKPREEIRAKLIWCAGWEEWSTKFGLLPDRCIKSSRSQPLPFPA